jgi:citrate lyase subunit beta / citryl-CoA lyase
VAPVSPNLARSYLYVPAANAARLETAAGRGPEAVIADLEDSVAPAQKTEAVRNAAAWTHGEGPPPQVERWVRINAGPSGLRDIEAVFGPHLTGVCLPKADPEFVLSAGELLTGLERDAGAPAQHVALMPLVETARGVTTLDEIARAPRVHRLQLGEIDLAADLGLEPGEDDAELAPIRSATVVASAAAGLLPPVGAVSPEFRDLARLRITTDRLRRAGFVGRAAIHPAQLETIHSVFTLSPAQLAAARAGIAAYEQALADGTGAMVGHDGRMVDEAVVKRWRRIIALGSSAERSSE